MSSMKITLYHGGGNNHYSSDISINDDHIDFDVYNAIMIKYVNVIHEECNEILYFLALLHEKRSEIIDFLHYEMNKKNIVTSKKEIENMLLSTIIDDTSDQECEEFVETTFDEMYDNYFRVLEIKCVDMADLSENKINHITKLVHILKYAKSSI